MRFCSASCTRSHSPTRLGIVDSDGYLTPLVGTDALAALALTKWILSKDCSDHTESPSPKLCRAIFLVSAMGSSGLPWLYPSVPAWLLARPDGNGDFCIAGYDAALPLQSKHLAFRMRYALLRTTAARFRQGDSTPMTKNMTSVVSRLQSSLKARTDAVSRSLLKNSGWAAVGQFLSAAVSFGETIVLARYFSVTDFGAFVTMASVADLINSLLEFRSGEAVIKFIPELRASKGIPGTLAFLKLIFLLDVIVALAAFTIIVTFGRVILGWVSLQAVYFPALLIISVGFATRGIVGTVEAYFRICGRFDQVAKLYSISLLTRLTLLVVVGLVVPTLPAVSWATAGADLLYFVLIGGTLLFVLRHSGFGPGSSELTLIKDIRRPLTTFLLSTNLIYSVRTLSSKLDTLLIAGLTSPPVVAIYKLSARFALILVLLSDPLGTAIFPELSHLNAGGRIVQIRKVILTLSSSMAAGAAVLVGGFAVAGHWILKTFAGPQYDSAYPVVLIMFLGSAAAMIFFWVRPLLLVRGKAHLVAAVTTVALLVQVGGLYLLLPSMGAFGAGLVFALTYVFTTVSLSLIHI